jgi:hypothetical protein
LILAVLFDLELKLGVLFSKRSRSFFGGFGGLFGSDGTGEEFSIGILDGSNCFINYFDNCT